MKKGLTELVFIMDKSGSMSGLESDAVGGFNATIKKQLEIEGEVLISTVLFSQDFKVVHDRVDIKEVTLMTEADYRVGGSTALIDAIGRGIHHISNVHKCIREEDRPEHTMFVIMTDGLENASREYSSDKVKKMIEEKKTAGWEFIFLGADIDAVETAKRFGIDEEHSVNYVHDKRGVKASFDSVCMATCMIREGRPKYGWKDAAEKDYLKREKNKKEKS